MDPSSNYKGVTLKKKKRKGKKGIFPIFHKISKKK